MKKSRIGMLGAVMALGGLMGTAQATQPLSQAQHQQQASPQGEIKATVERKREKAAININALGGLDMPPLFYNSFPSPIWFGKNQCKGKTNKNRCKHNAKLKRRKG